MKRHLALLATTLLLASCTDVPTQPTVQEPVFSAADVVGDRYIVVLRDAQNAQAITASKTASLGIVPDFVYRRALPGFAATLTNEQLNRLRSDADIAFLERDGVVTLTTTQTPTPSWGLDRIDMRNLPLDNRYTYNVTGQGVRFYGLDTGIRTTHQDFAGRSAPGFSVYSGGTNDCNGHGTHTASTAAGTTYGVAKGMTVVPVRVLNCSGSGTTAGVIAGVDWVTQNAVLPAVANMSLSGSASAALDLAVANSVAAGVVYAVAAGNDYGLNACLRSPAREPSALAVAATDMTDTRAVFSNIGTCVDLFGPGVGIVAAWNTSNTAAATVSGTSMSSPHVAGVAGLYLEANPSATPAQVAAGLTANATTGVVANPGSGSPNRLLYMGFIAAGPPNQPPVASFTYACDVTLLCTFDGTGSTDDRGIVLYEWLGPGGGVLATGPTWVNQFSRPTTIQFSLRVTDAGGLQNTQTQSVVVAPPTTNQPPVANFSWSCNGLSCTFDGTSSTDDAGIVSWAWTDGTGQSIGTGSILAYTFASAGTFNITLTVTDAGGLSDSQTQAVTVSTLPPNQPPVASFTYTCDANLVCTFDGTGSTDDQGIVLYEWLGPGGGVLATGPTWVNQFSRATTIQFSLRVTDAGGLQDTQTQSVVVAPPTNNQPPVASFTYTCSNLRCTFDGTGSTDDNGIVLYEWLGPGGGVLATGPTWVNQFSRATTIQFSLRVTDAGGLQDTQTQQVVVQ